MSDSRIEKAQAAWPFDVIVARTCVPLFVGAFESSGLIVWDPADPAVIDRVVRTLFDRDVHGNMSWENALPAAQGLYQRDARAVLAALGGDRA